MMYILLLVGFVLLVKGADFFVEGSSSVAKMFKIPSVIVGLTIVAMGTSAPELAVSLTASLAGSNDMALSNVIGSNIFNLMVVIGACAIIKGVDTPTDILKRDLPLNIGVTALLLLFIWDLRISRIEGIILLICMVAYITVLVVQALKNRTEAVEEEEKPLSPLMSVVYIIGGIAAIVFGGDLVVDNASAIAAAFGLSQTLIGLTIVAMGTSLPELVTSIVATRKGETGLALGNAVGSCLFNILLILGVSSTVSPINANSQGLMDTIILLGITVVSYIFARTSEKTNRVEGIICLVIYAAYMVYAIIR
ncbi:MAG: calcium/sodium antiporter [Cellulosilyticum sp.]|nr:calcium/sodium antiporter [Cellulosilyticum sp.]